jgi:hypothetical protein
MNEFELDRVLFFFFNVLSLYTCRSSQNPMQFALLTSTLLHNALTHRTTTTLYNTLHQANAPSNAPSNAQHIKNDPQKYAG